MKKIINTLPDNNENFEKTINVLSNELKSDEEIYPSIKEAAASIDTKMEDWKVQMLICDAINHKKRAFKCKWDKRD